MEIDALSRGQTILLQRLMAAHAMSDHAAQKLYQEICQLCDNNNNGEDELVGHMGASLEKCFGQINKQLAKAFGLEIATISLQQQQQRYHAVINQHADDIAKKSFLTSGGSDNTARKWNTISRTPSEHEYIRQVLQCLVERGAGGSSSSKKKKKTKKEPSQEEEDDDDEEEEDDDDENAKATSTGTYEATRVDLINLKNDLKAPYKLNMEGAEQCLRTLWSEQWLAIAASKNSSDDNKKRRRESLQSKIGLGPRSFLELPQLLTEFGYPKDELPQTIFYRA